MYTKIGLAMEVPTKYLDLMCDLVDWHFVIATECLKDPKYFSWYRSRPERVKIMLDNGMFEEGKPMSPAKLAAIAEELKADVVFAPDLVGDRQATLAMTEEFLNLSFHAKWQVGMIPQGHDPEDIVQCFEDFISRGYLSLGMGPPVIGLSFLNDRPEVVRLMKRKGYFDMHDIWFHMLGLYNTQEIAEWPSTIKTMDTVKPFKAAYHNYEVVNCPRGLGKWDTKMTFPIEAHGVSLLFKNIATMHKILTREVKYGNHHH
jgi:hypothetical protein